MRPWIMFTKHLEGWSLGQIIEGLKSAGVNGADLCVRPGYPVHPGNVRSELVRAVKQFADEGLCIPLVTAPGELNRSDLDDAQPMFEACAEAGVGLIKLGYWHMEDDGYWPSIERCRGRLEGFVALGERTGVKPIIHNHSGEVMSLNSSSVMNIVSQFDPAQVGVFADVGHLSIVGEPYPMAFDIVKKYLAAVAFKDLMRQKIIKDGEPAWQTAVVPMGSGFGDFPQVVSILRQIGFAGPISFHCEYSRLPPESVIDQCRIDTRWIESLCRTKAT